MKKQYTYENVTYGYSPASRKWEFNISTFTLLTICPDGNETGKKIAKLLQAGYIRSNKTGLDGLARANINSVIARAKNKLTSQLN